MPGERLGVDRPRNTPAQRRRYKLWSAADVRCGILEQPVKPAKLG